MSTLKKRPRRSLLDSDEESEDLFANGDLRSRPKVAKTQSIEGMSPSCEFLANLNTAGLNLDPSRDFEIPHKLNCEQALFKKKLEQSLSSNSDEKMAFLDQCKTYLDVDNTILLKALMPVKASSDSCQDPESFLRI